MSKDLIKEKLNKFGSSKEPFLFVLSYDLSKFYIQKLSLLPSSIKFEFNSKEIKSLEKEIILEKFPIDFNKYKTKFDLLQEEIKNGNTYLCNLTVKTKIKTSITLDEIYDLVQSKFKLRFQNENDNFVCFSPERFIEIKENKIFTYPMKGTIDASIPNAKEIILNDIKEMAEHTMVVDLLRNDLGIIANNVRVDKFRYVEKINAGDDEDIKEVSLPNSLKLMDFDLTWSKSDRSDFDYQELHRLIDNAPKGVDGFVVRSNSLQYGFSQVVIFPHAQNEI